jgi:hypothetical protein
VTSSSARTYKAISHAPLLNRAQRSFEARLLSSQHEDMRRAVVGDAAAVEWLRAVEAKIKRLN